MQALIELPNNVKEDPAKISAVASKIDKLLWIGNATNPGTLEKGMLAMVEEIQALQVAVAKTNKSVDISQICFSVGNSNFSC